MTDTKNLTIAVNASRRKEIVGWAIVLPGSMLVAASGWDATLRQALSRALRKAKNYGFDGNVAVTYYDPWSLHGSVDELSGSSDHSPVVDDVTIDLYEFAMTRNNMSGECQKSTAMRAACRAIEQVRLSRGPDEVVNGALSPNEVRQADRALPISTVPQTPTVTWSRGCHHPPFVLNVEEVLKSREAERLSRQLSRTNPMDILAIAGIDGYVTVVECSWCRNPDEHTSTALAPLQCKGWLNRARRIAGLKPLRHANDVEG